MDNMIITLSRELNKEQKDYLLHFVLEIIFGHKVLAANSNRDQIERAISNNPELIFKEKSVLTAVQNGDDVHIVNIEQISPITLERLYDALNYLQDGTVKIL